MQLACLASLLFLSTLFLVPTQCFQEWVVKLDSDQQPADLASEIGLKYVGPLKGPLGKNHHRFHSFDKRQPTKDSLKFHQQQAVQRIKRDFNSSDPLWNAAWYYHGPESLVDIIPVWEQNLTGKGVVLAIVDDGVQHSNPDLLPNYLPEASWDFNSNDPDPSPLFPRDNHHGTSCAGTAGGARNNGVCLHGSAYEVSLAGIKLIEQATTDAQEAEALTHSLDVIDIYSCSWGPSDDGLNTSPAGPITQDAMLHGVTQGRQGKGAIYVWAGGNGGREGDNCNYDGLANSPYTIAIGALSHLGIRSTYSEPGAALFAVCPSSGDGAFILTTTTSAHSASQCTSTFGGTSAATPFAAGVIALILQANHDLTWREVQHVIVESATKVDPSNPDWITNGAGREVNHEYGFGLINAATAVEVARTWSKSIHHYQTFASETIVVNQPILDNRPTMTNISVSEEDCGVTSIEHVQVVLKTNHPKDTDLTVVLTSPSGTRSVLAESHAFVRAPVMTWTTYVASSVVQTGAVAGIGYAEFGPELTFISGEIVVIDPPTACSPLPQVSRDSATKKIALVLRGDCTFYDKVLNVQSSGYDAVLIENTSFQASNMYSGQTTDLATIPALMIGSSDGQILRSQFNESGNLPRVEVSIFWKYYKQISNGFVFDDWTFTSVRHWGESPFGVWTLEILDNLPEDEGTFESWSLKISGGARTTEKKEHKQKHKSIKINNS